MNCRSQLSKYANKCLAMLAVPLTPVTTEPELDASLLTTHLQTTKLRNMSSFMSFNLSRPSLQNTKTCLDALQLSINPAIFTIHISNNGGKTHYVSQEKGQREEAGGHGKQL